MSYFGLAVLARSWRPLRTVDCFTAVDSFASVDETEYPGGWRLGYLYSPDYHGPTELAAELVAETGAPAIAMYINDDAYAEGACCSPQGNTCEFYLDEQAFLEYCADFDAEDLAGLQLERNDAAVGVLQRWASEAGLTADPDGLTEALATGPLAPEHGVQQLVGALGIGAQRTLP